MLKLSLRRRHSFSSQASCTLSEGSAVAGTDETEADECEKLVQKIKRTAAEFMSGYTQLNSNKFKKEVAASQSAFSFFQRQQSVVKMEQMFIVRDFVDCYRSFKVSERLYADLQRKQ